MTFVIYRQESSVNRPSRKKSLQLEAQSHLNHRVASSTASWPLLIYVSGKQLRRLPYWVVVDKEQTRLPWSTRLWRSNSPLQAFKTSLPQGHLWDRRLLLLKAHSSSSRPRWTSTRWATVWPCNKPCLSEVISLTLSRTSTQSTSNRRPK